MSNFNRAMLASMILSAAASAEDAADGGSAAAATIPAGFTAISKVFHFRKFKDTPENRTGKLPNATPGVDKEGRALPLADHLITVSAEQVEGVQVFQRTPETHVLVVPTPEYFGLVRSADTEKVYVVLQDTLTNFMMAAARALVDLGQTPNQTNCSWELVCSAEYTRLTTVAADSGSGISSDILKDFAGKYAAYMKALGKPESGIVATSKMITGRFGRMATMNYLEVMHLVVASISLFFTEGLDEQQQNGYAAVMEYLLQKAEEATKPAIKADPSMFG